MDGKINGLIKQDFTKLQLVGSAQERKKMTKNIYLEVCCGSVDDSIEAQIGGAQRVELNSSMFFGGLTPSLGAIIEAKKRLNIPVIVMIRPRGGGFCYTDAEYESMLHDTRLALDYGADGIVFGI